jgi:hypothetical protein
MRLLLMANSTFLNISFKRVSFWKPARPHSRKSITGGDVNVTDDDGDTPLYTVENVATASFLVQHGATVDRRNHEGVSVRMHIRDLHPIFILGQPIEHLGAEYPEVAEYLCSTMATSTEPCAVSEGAVG